MGFVGRAPEPDAALYGVGIGTEDDPFGQMVHKLGVAAAEQHIVCDEGGAKAGDDVEDRLAPALFAAAFETDYADVVLVGEAVFVGEVGDLQRDDGAIEDKCGAQAGAGAEEEHTTAAVAAEGLHGCVIEEAEGLVAEGFLVGEVYPAEGEVMGFGKGAVVEDGTGVADRDGVVVPGGGGGEDLLGHESGGHVRPGGDLDRDEVIGGGDFDMGSTDVDD